MAECRNTNCTIVLDDNTYTNKTWADVTLISVKEIHLMEVEFLSNMRYQLMVTVEEWNQWLQKINMFVRYQQKQQTMTFASINNLPIGLPSPTSPYEYAPFPLSNNGYRYQATLLNPMQMEGRGRKRSLGDAHIDLHCMLPPHKKIISQPSTPQRGSSMMLRPRPEQTSYRDISPLRKQNMQTHVMRALPSITNKSLTPAIPATRPAPSQRSTYSSLSPSHLQVGNVPSTGTSPTTSSISHFSSHSHGPALGYSPTSLALQHRDSPYAPVQPVQRLVGRYQPIFNPAQVAPTAQQSLWYSQLAAGSNQPVYSGQLPLSLHGSPYPTDYPPRA